MARSVLEIILSLKGDKARRELKKVDKEFNKVDKSAKKSVGALKKFDAKMALVAGGAGLAAAGVVKLGQAIWNMGKQGAAIIQTGKSFEFLLEKVGAASDLLDQLTEATLGTVDAGTLMESTLTLTAGAGDDLTKMMMEAAPQLAKIAKAANKLNPALGDTAFMYQSIGTGVKRAQPLILDNLGLTIKVGTANEDFAKSIGKTVEELTAEEKSMAILNATLEAGDTLIAQVGGSVEAVGDEMAIAEAKIANMTGELKTRLVPVVAEASDKFVELIDRADELSVKYIALDQAVQDGVITREEMIQLLIDLQSEQITEAELLDELTEKTKKLADENWNLKIHQDHLIHAMAEYAEATGWAAGQDRAYIEVLQDVGEETEEAAKAAEEYAKRMDRLNQESADAIETLRGLVDIKIKDFFDVDLGIGDVAARMFDITNFKEFGGEALEIMVKEVQAGLTEGKITPEQSREFFKNIAVEAEAIKVQMGEIDASEAAKSISEEFNVPIAESRELIDSVLEGIDLVNSADISAITEEFDALQERKELLMEEGEIPIEADPQDEAHKKLVQLQDDLFLLTSDPWIIEFNIITKGKIPTPSGETVVIPGSGGQHGLDMIVPPGFKNDSYPIWTTSGEHVTVTPKGDIGKREPVINNFYITVADDRDAEELALDIAEVYRTRMD